MSDKPRYKLDSQAMYAVFREIIRRDETYKSEIAEDLEKSVGAVGDTLDSLKYYGIVKETRRTKAQFYKVHYDGLVSVFEDVWDLESTPEKFQDFLQRYVELYDKGDSSIRKMLREDFAEAAVSYKRKHGSYPDSLTFLDEIPQLEGFIPVQDYFEKAVEQEFEK
ncbi:MAG: hypothetical protein ABEJ72_00265 [Candidatus Aenigmatarchaeota archaeon]